MGGLVAAKSVQKNLRISEDLNGRLKRFAEEMGLSESELLRRGIELVTTGAPALPGHGPGVSVAENRRVARKVAADQAREIAAQQPRASGQVVDLAVWLSGRTGQPRSLMRRAIAQGQVQIGGFTVEQERVNVELLSDVRLRGRPV